VSSANALNFDVGQMLALLVAVLLFFFVATASVVLILIDFLQLAKIGGKIFVLSSERTCCYGVKVYHNRNFG